MKKNYQGVIFRKLKEKEERSLTRVMRRIYDEEFDEDMFLEWQKKSGDYPFVQWFVAEKDDRIIGLTRWYLYDSSEKEIMLMLSWTAIEKEYERKGITARLVNESFKIVRNYWKKQGLKISSVWVETEISNKRARKFYKKAFSCLDFQVKEKKIRKTWRDDGVVFIFGIKRKSIF